MTSDFSSRYPRTVTLNERALTLRLMNENDGDALLAFGRSLPPDDLLFLRLDIASPAGVAEWLDNLREQPGRTGFCASFELAVSVRPTLVATSPGSSSLIQVYSGCD